MAKGEVKDLTGKTMFAKGYVVHSGVQYYNVKVDVGDGAGQIDNASAQRLVTLGLLIPAGSDEARELLKGKADTEDAEGPASPQAATMTPTGPVMTGPPARGPEGRK